MAPVRAAAADAATATVSSSETSTQKVKKSDELEEVVVTGSLIPQLRTETATPVTLISADEIQIKEFSSVADAL